MSASNSTTANNKFPEGEPTKEWTIEQLLHHTLHQYHQKALDETSQLIRASRERCQMECDDIRHLHNLAVQMSKMPDVENEYGNGEKADVGVDGDVGKRDASIAEGQENVDPQTSGATDATTHGKGLKSTHSSQSTNTTSTTSTTTKEISNVRNDTTKTTSNGTTNSSNAITSANATNATIANPTSPSNPALQIHILTGPHSNSRWLLRPKPNQPCLVGRSKGKKFVKNGISLSKDAEVSTTHGKILVEYVVGSGVDDEGNSGGGGGDGGNGGDGGSNSRGRQVRFYFLDIGSTNGTFYNDQLVQPNVKLLLREGMELRVGGSNMKIMFG